MRRASIASALRSGRAAMLGLVVLSALAVLPSCAPSGRTGPGVVFAAASTADAVREAAAAFASSDRGFPVQVSAAASGVLARQILAGAPADVFISADPAWIDQVVRAGGAAAEHVSPLLTNTLVVIARNGSAADGAGVELVLRTEKRISMGDPARVPAGVYAREALEAAGLWGRIQDRIAPAADAVAALRAVERGLCDVGIVYRSDAARSGEVTIVHRFGPTEHSPIVYNAALLSHERPAARAFVEFLSSGTARAMFEGRGFGVARAERENDRALG